jgi:hypothetical protein
MLVEYTDPQKLCIFIIEGWLLNKSFQYKILCYKSSAGWGEYPNIDQYEWEFNALDSWMVIQWVKAV